MFKELFETGKVSGWSLNLVGSASSGDKDYLEELKKIAKGLPINFYPNLDYDKLVKLYGESSVYWHASGFGEKDPTKMEHFGISTVEAMAAGCVPIVINKGGQVEIVEHNKSGYLFNSLSELKKFTLKVINLKDNWQKMSKIALERSHHFSKKRFRDKINQLIKI